MWCFQSSNNGDVLRKHVRWLRVYTQSVHKCVIFQKNRSIWRFPISIYNDQFYQLSSQCGTWQPLLYLLPIHSMYIINIPDVVLECYSVCAFVDRVDDECMSQQKQTSWTTYSAYNHFFNVMFSNFMQLPCPLLCRLLMERIF